MNYLAEPPGADGVVIFVQGLQGGLYDATGSHEGAGHLIKRLRSDLPALAVAAIDYPWDLRRFRADRSLAVEPIVRDLAQALGRDLFDRYRTVVIVGHCLGGLLTTMALPHLLTTRVDLPGRLRRDENRLIVFLLDSPHDLPEGRLGSIHSGLLEALRLPGAALEENARFWRSRVLAEGPDRVPIRAYAVTTQEPSWVTPLNPEAGLPACRVCRVPVAHEAVVDAPAAGPFAPYDFLLSRLRKAGVDTVPPQTTAGV